MNAPSIEERVKRLEAAQAYHDRRARRTIEALKSAAAQLMALSPSASLHAVIEAIRAAAGQLIGYTKDGG